MLHQEKNTSYCRIEQQEIHVQQDKLDNRGRNKNMYFKNMQIPGINIRNAQIKQCTVARTDVQLASSDVLRYRVEYCKVHIINAANWYKKKK
jgi:hypothetical protein